jgi:hypothetical protein
MNGNADLVKWWTLMATDIITQIRFGDDPQMAQSGPVHFVARSKQVGIGWLEATV